MTVNEWMRAARARLEGLQNPDAATDARLLVCGQLGVEPGQVRLWGAKQLSPREEQALNAKLLRRAAGEPLQYIEGEAWFMGLRFSVDARVLIPRQDTETLCETALNELKGRPAPRVLDLCTGSGALAVAIAQAAPRAQVIATDISAEALCVARENATANAVEITFLQGDGFEAVEGQKFDLIVCNPPYLTRQDMLNLQEEVRYEPALALFGGMDGLDLYRRFATDLSRHLLPGGSAMFEVGEGQARDVETILKCALPGSQSGIINDLCGIDRVVWIRSLS